MSDEYDEETCMTAGELRAVGAKLPDTIPDCGWIPRHALRLGDCSATSDGKRVNVGVSFSVSAPFRWVEVRGTIEETTT